MIKRIYIKEEKKNAYDKIIIKKKHNGVIINFIRNNMTIASFSNYQTDEGQQNDWSVKENYRGSGIGTIGILILIYFSFDILGGFETDRRGMTKDGEAIWNKINKEYMNEDGSMNDSLINKVESFIEDNENIIEIIE